MLHVTKQAHIVTLNNQFHANTTKQQTLLQLIAKAQRIYGYHRPYVMLPNCHTADGQELRIGVRYDIHTPVNRSDTYKISDINFQLIFRSSIVTYDLSTFKNEAKQVAVWLPKYIFGEFTLDTPEDIKQRLSSI